MAHSGTANVQFIVQYEFWNKLCFLLRERAEFSQSDGSHVYKTFKYQEKWNSYANGESWKAVW